MHSKVQKASGDLGQTAQEKIRINVLLEVELIADFDSLGSEIRLKGKNIEESEHLKVYIPSSLS